MVRNAGRDAPRVVQIILSLGQGGLETMAVNLAIGLKRQGVRPAIIALDEGGVLETPLRNAGVEFVILNGRRFKDPRFHVTLAGHLRRLRAVAVHTHMFAPLLHSLPGLEFAGVPRLVHTEHSFEYLEERASLRRALRWMSRTTKAFTVVGERMLPYYADIVGVARKRLHVIANGIDAERHRPAADQASIRTQLGIPPNAFVVGSAGRLAPEKNYRMLLSAAAQCGREGTPVHVALFGDGSERADLAALARDLGVAESVSFHGWRTDLHDVIGALDVFALTSDSEGLPLVLLEAMAAALPVVSTPVGDIPRVIDDGRTGFLVPLRDHAALAARLRGSLAERARRRAIGDAARQVIIERYSHEAMVRQYLSAYGVS